MYRAIINFMKSARPYELPKNTLFFMYGAWCSWYFLGLDISVLLISLVLYTVLYSCVYVINDCYDVEDDRRNPTKKFRPIASGALSIENAGGTALALVSLSVAAGLLLVNNLFALSLALMFLLNQLYSHSRTGLRKNVITGGAVLALAQYFKIMAGWAALGGSITAQPFVFFLVLTLSYPYLGFFLMKRAVEKKGKVELTKTDELLHRALSVFIVLFFAYAFLASPLHEIVAPLIIISVLPAVALRSTFRGLKSVREVQGRLNRLSTIIILLGTVITALFSSGMLVFPF